MAAHRSMLPGKSRLFANARVGFVTALTPLPFACAVKSPCFPALAEAQTKRSNTILFPPGDQTGSITTH
ncbi:MAG TPA: hypothetical protein VKB73_07220 [Gaiellaceae bacterium]|nr:hypothetical protein [Gaiellaceae bacterium]